MHTGVTRSPLRGTNSASIATISVTPSARKSSVMESASNLLSLQSANKGVAVVGDFVVFKRGHEHVLEGYVGGPLRTDVRQLRGSLVDVVAVRRHVGTNANPPLDRCLNNSPGRQPPIVRSVLYWPKKYRSTHIDTGHQGHVLDKLLNVRRRHVRAW